MKKAASTRAPEKMCCGGEGLMSGPASHIGVEITTTVASTATGTCQEITRRYTSHSPPRA